jgi:hypothetical protein
MALNEIANQAGRIQDESKAYLDSTFEYYKLWTFKVTMKSATTIIRSTLVLLFLTLVLFFGSVAAALAIGEAINSLPLGFLITGGFYLLILLLVLLLKEKMVEGPVLRKFSEIFFNE